MIPFFSGIGIGIALSSKWVGIRIVGSKSTIGIGSIAGIGSNVIQSTPNTRSYLEKLLLNEVNWYNPTFLHLWQQITDICFPSLHISSSTGIKSTSGSGSGLNGVGIGIIFKKRPKSNSGAGSGTGIITSLIHSWFLGSFWLQWILTILLNQESKMLQFDVYLVLLHSANSEIWQPWHAIFGNPEK